MSSLYADDTLPHNMIPANYAPRDRCWSTHSTPAQWHMTNDTSITVIIRYCCHQCDIYLPSNAHLTSDLNQYCFPQCIEATNLSPDIMWWDDAARSMHVVQLTIDSLWSIILEAAERKLSNMSIYCNKPEHLDMLQSSSHWRSGQGVWLLCQV